jgi:hypothetical protein
MRIPRLIKTMALLICLALPTAALAAGNISATDKFAWSETAGWKNFAPTHGGVTVYADHLEGYAWQENCGWIKLGSHTGGGPLTYDNTSKTNWGVNRESGGGLAGFAWSETAGWINFAPTGGGVTINPVSGLFDGYAWGENIGWIGFRSQSGAAVAYGVGLFSYKLTLSFPGNGAGSVVSTSPPFSCNTGCVKRFVEITPLTLTANQSEYSLPGVWNGCDSVSGRDCNLTLNSDRTVKVDFTRDTEYTARIYGTTPTNYSTLQKAYDKAVTGNVIEVWGIDLGAGLICGAGTNVTILGGYDQPYHNQTGMTTLHGLTIGRGTVTVDRIVVK